MAWAPDYVTSTELKAYLRISDTDDDAQVALAITAASRAVDRHTNRQFGLVAAAEERFYTATWDPKRRRRVVEIDDLMTETGLLVDYDADDDETFAHSVDSFNVRPVNAKVIGRPWTRIVVRTDSTTLPGPIENGVRVTAKFGWTTVPDTVKQATLLQASRLFTRREAPFGVAGSPDLGSELRLLAKVDPDVAVSLGPYIRWWAAA
jgi:uncharacterized phiE125 gp8 family phage protein